MQLAGKTILVTGADSGIGQAAAILFAGEGADVAVTYHTDREGGEVTRKAIEETGRKAHLAQLDVRDPQAIAQVFADAEKTFGRKIDILLANAGTSMGEHKLTVAEMDDEKMDLILKTNLYGALYSARAYLQHRGWNKDAAEMGGKIIFVSSVAGHLPTSGSSPYGMSKAGLNSLIRSLSVELAEQKINVTGIAPGLIDTPMTQPRLDDDESREKSFEAIPFHRAGEALEIARLALFLAADSGDYVTGQVWTMDGGLTMNWGGA